MKRNDKLFVPLIWTVSIVVPVVVGILMKPGLLPPVNLGFDPMILSKLNASINSIVSILLILAVIAIKKKQVARHRILMLTAFGLSVVFLVSYVLYHLAVGHRPYCDEGMAPPVVYYFILITHILLSVSIIPLACFAIYRGLTDQLEKHRKIVRFTFPLWLYVSVTGVLVYVINAAC